MDHSTNIQALIGELTLEEKATLSLGSDFWHTAPVDRLGIPAIHVSDGPHGLRSQPQRGDHVGIGGSLPATCFPTASALGSSWDPDLARRVGEALGREAREQNVSVVLGPGINIKRSPLCGRNFEYLSEDPRLAGEVGAALIEGVQSQGVGTSVKHYAANNQETDRLRVSADVDERALREIYLPAFEQAVTQAEPWTVMCSYNKVNGVYASENRWLLTEVLRNEWDFDGLVVSDWGAVNDIVAAVAAGLNLEMPPNIGASDAALVEAVRSGLLDEAVLDESVATVLQLVQRALTGKAQPVEPVDTAAHHRLARTAAADSAVLLKNADEVLPLGARSGTLAVIGEFARTPRYQGSGSSQVNTTRVDVALDEIRAAAGTQVGFAAGFGVGTTENDATLAEEAVALARSAGTVLLFLGLANADESEGFDREHMALPANQRALIAQLAEVNENIVVVLSNGSAVEVAGWERHAKAILELWLGGQAAGGAATDVLFGVVNPSGKLAETMPVRLEDNPSFLNFPGDDGHVRYGEGIFVGYRHYDAVGREVSYPFGHGLSYTTFEYGDIAATVSGSSEAGDLAVSVTATVANTGTRRGKEAVQLYVRDIEASVARPVRELKGFVKVDLDAGESTPVTFELSARDLSYWSTRVHGWVLEAGEFEITLGASSRDLRGSVTVCVDAPPVFRQLSAESSLEEWMTNPRGREVLVGAVGTDESGNPLGVIGSEEMMKIIGNFPLNRLPAFEGMGIDDGTVRTVVAAVRPVGVG